MVLRNIIHIDEEKCDGCGLCVTACAEGAIKIIDGKAKLVSEIYCDGLGDCIGHCPQDAIIIERREAEEFDEQATNDYLAKKESSPLSKFVCPGIMSQSLKDKAAPAKSESAPAESQLNHWPVQLKLVSPEAAYLTNTDLLWVADCVPFAMGDFHDKFLKNHSVVIGCPKLDDSGYYIEKLAQIIKTNKLNSLSVIHMEVPCCSGLTHIAKEAIIMSKVKISFNDITIGLRGNVIKTEVIS